MKKFICFFCASLLVVTLLACSADEEPAVRMRNDRSTKANVQLKTSGGSTININDVAPGQTTDYQNIADGRVDATASIQNESVSPTASFNASKNNKYTVVVVSGNPPTLRVE